MITSMTMITVASIFSIEWHDGHIVGILRSKDKCLLFIMLAWDPDSHDRRYAAVECDWEKLEGVRSSFDHLGISNELEEQIAKHWNNAEEYLLFTCEPSIGKDVFLSLLPGKPECAISPPIIDNATSESMIKKWIK